MILVVATGEEALAALERMRLAIESHDWQPLAPGLRLTISAGMAAWQRGEGVSDLLSRADTALYAAKDAGGNFVRESLTSAPAARVRYHEGDTGIEREAAHAVSKLLLFRQPA